jgi:DNA-binding NarL/FixJ family response regulator
MGQPSNFWLKQIEIMSAIDPITVWIIEDDRLFRKTVQKLLIVVPEVGAVEAYPSCEVALAELHHGQVPDIVLMDIGLPGMSGIEGIRKFKARSPNTHIIMLTVHEDNDKIFNAICTGASGYLLKPSSRSRILEAIDVARRGGASINPQIAGKVLNMFSQLASPPTDYGLTEREREILQLMAQDLNKPAIAEKLYLSYHTIGMHVRNIYSKLHVHTATGAIAKAVKERLI